MAYSFDKVCRNVIPTGTYKAQVADIKFKTGAAGVETNDIQVHWVIAEGSEAKKTIIDTIYEKAFSFRLKPFLKAVDVDTAREFATAKELYEYGMREAKGKFAMIEVGIRTYNGNEYNQINGFAPLPSSSTSVEDVMREFGTEEDAFMKPTVSPESIPEKPRVDDIPDLTDDSPFVEVSDEDIPL